MWKFLKRKITEKKPHQIWWFLKRTNLIIFHHIKCESSWIGTFLKRNHIIYDSSCQRKEVLEICHVAWQLQPHTTVPWVYCFNIFELQISDFFHFVLCGLRHVMSICRYVDMSMWFDVVTATVRNLRRLVGILFTAIFSPFCDGYGKEQCDLNSRVHHSSSYFIKNPIAKPRHSHALLWSYSLKLVKILGNFENTLHDAFNPDMPDSHWGSSSHFTWKNSSVCSHHLLCLPINLGDIAWFSSF